MQVKVASRSTLASRLCIIAILVNVISFTACEDVLQQGERDAKRSEESPEHKSVEKSAAHLVSAPLTD